MLYKVTEQPFGQIRLLGFYQDPETLRALMIARKPDTDFTECSTVPEIVEAAGDDYDYVAITNDYPEVTRQQLDVLVPRMKDRIREYLEADLPADCHPGLFLSAYLDSDPRFLLREFVSAVEEAQESE